jgi:hypothetical protein
MHSRLLAFLPYLLYGQALLCCPTNLLNAQPLARCPALSSLWTGSSMLSWLTFSMHSRLLAVLPYLHYGLALLCYPNSPCSMHSHLLAVLPYLLYRQALLCCPNSPCSMHSHLLAVLPYLLYGQAILCCPYSPANCTAACCPALFSLWTGSSMLS